jgi:hypothetical protein
MRALNIICGIAILIAALHLVHGVHHFYGHTQREGLHGLGLWGALGGASLMIIFSVIGAIQLFRRPN